MNGEVVGGGGERRDGWWCIIKRQEIFKKNLTFHEQAKSIYIKHMCTYYSIGFVFGSTPTNSFMNTKKLCWKQVYICTLWDNRVGKKIHSSMNKSRRMMQSVTTHLVSSPTKGYQVHCLRWCNLSYPKGGNIYMVGHPLSPYESKGFF